MRRVLVGTAAVATSLGWLQLAAAFGFPVTAPAAMLDRMLGAHREAGAAGWALLLVGEAVLVAAYFLVVEPRTRGVVAPIAYGLGAWLLSGAVLMPIIGLIQGAPPAGDATNDPMRATFFMLNLGPLAAVESLVAWLLFGSVLAAGRDMDVRPRDFYLTSAVVALAAVVAFAFPIAVMRTNESRVVEGSVATLPPGPVFISVLELPQPPGAVLGPHAHIPGFVVDVSGTETMAVAGGGTVDVGPGGSVFIPNLQAHSHENRAAVPAAFVLSVLLVGLTVALVAGRWRGRGVVLLAALLAIGVVATIDPLMNHWYFVGVRPAPARGAVMPVPAAHRTYESENLTVLAGGPYTERLTYRWLTSGDSARISGPGAIVLLEGEGSITVGGRTTRLSAQSGVTIAGGADAMLEAGSQGARILVVQVLPRV
jgi:mannose-6-phosphate isomerase-like protein (cupin superfamily)